MQWVRSLIFNTQMYVMLFVIAIFYAPWAIIDRRGAFAAIHAYCRWVRWTASWMVGLKSEIRGEVPTGEVLIASKHQSFFDVLVIVSVVPRPRFIMKASLKWAPVLGFYGWRTGCVPVDRGKKTKSITQMVEGVKNSAHIRGQLIIYSQGTRVAPGVKRPYKIGTGILYEQTGQACVPVATNIGVFWPRIGVLRKPGLAVVEFLPVIEPGLPKKQFMSRLEDSVETASNRLMAEAGFEVE